MKSQPIQPREKIQTIDRLGEIAEQARADGLTVVLCHGVYDLLHMGHVRHLEVARSEKSVLIVTVTADAFVNKGPGRPVFTEAMRAEMVAAIEYVDWVGISHFPTSTSIVETIKPDFYVKGADYKDMADDVSGNIISEKDSVEKHGGQIVFTDEVSFSSSTLINKYLDIYDPPLRSYLDSMREEGALDELIQTVEKIAGYRILFIGDAIIDEYRYVVPMGKSPKENMIATIKQGEEIFAGGVFAAANHVAGFSDNVEICTCLGDLNSFEDLIRDSLHNNINLSTITRPNAVTTRKSRYIDNSYTLRKLFEVYDMDDRPLGREEEDKLYAFLQERIDQYDVVVVTDFGHGMMTPRIISLVTESSSFLAVNAQSNSANLGYNLITKYANADYICLDGTEARLAMGDKYSALEQVLEDGLAERIDCDKMVVTMGKHGCLAFERGVGISRVPALTGTIVDTVGAGDAFFAISAPLVAAGARMDHAGFLGNAAGAMKVGIVGHRSSIDKVGYLKFLTALLK